jgi:hypothetical protein
MKALSCRMSKPSSIEVPDWKVAAKKQPLRVALAAIDQPRTVSTSRSTV